MIQRVELSGMAQKQLKKVPRHVAGKLFVWVDDVQTYGLEEVRKIPGYHDEPLRGVRRGQRSIRLSRSYRAVYAVENDGVLEFVLIEEVTKHEY